MNVFNAVLLLCLFSAVRSSYLITTPRRWTQGSLSQICVVLNEGQFSESDSLSYSLEELKLEGIFEQNKELPLPIGESQKCLDVVVPHSDDSKITLDIRGSLGGLVVSDSFNLTVVKSGTGTFIQTDKFLYQKGQEVQFRILTVGGTDLNVSTQNYDEVYVSDPSRTRIAQWLDVDNSKGLVHLSFDLHDEADEGSYSVNVRFPDGRVEKKLFRVEEYVLPKYEVTLEAPKPILGSDEIVTIKLCARYTFGEPVAGRVNISLATGSWKTYANLTQTRKIKGCDSFNFSSKDLLFDHNNCHIRVSKLQASAVLVEEGTDVEIYGSNNFITVHRTALSFSDNTPKHIKKPFLPYNVKFTAKHPDGTPAASEPMNVCTHYMEENVCKNFTTDASGMLSLILPSNANSRVEIKAVNFPRLERNWNDVMHASTFNVYRRSYQSYTNDRNTSLNIHIPEKPKCTTGQDVVFDLPLIYIVNDQPTADVHIQISSRGQVVKTEKIPVNFEGSDLPYSEAEQLLPLEKLPPGFTRGVINVPIALPVTVSPKIKVIAWFSTPDGVVVADSKEVRMDDCLKHAVDMSWSSEKVEPGKEATLSLKGAENALCSIGVVDKSVNLLSLNSNSLTASSILQLVINSEMKSWDEDQLDIDYCYSKYNYSELALERQGKSSPSGMHYHFSSIYEALHSFMDAGYFVSSNLDLEKAFCDELFVRELKRKSLENSPPPPPGIPMPRPDITRTRVSQSSAFSNHLGAAPPMGANSPQRFMAEDHSDILVEEKTINEDEVATRDYLPETWLWQLKPLSATGEFSEVMTLPDTITEWVGNAVCVHPTEGVGISKSSSITTFTPFFVDLTLPASATRGEILPLKASVFNYLDEDLPVKLVVENSEDYSLIEGETGVREICVPAKSKSVETVKIALSKIGDVNVTVEASSQAGSSGSCGSGSPPVKRDRLVRSLPVEAEGYLREKTWTKYICTEDLDNQEGPLESWNIEPPSSIVPDSGRAWITAIGDLMGPTIENLGNLVRFPRGCGEQNMINFAPNVYILQYLEISGQNTEALSNKLTRFLSSGYRSQLKFKHGNHSYSTFGKRDPQGSTWLTAFVVKSFSQARPYTFIDSDSLSKSIAWLKGLQNKEGCFESRGRVINKQIQGGLKTNGKDNLPLMTAYVLAALLEEGNATENADVDAAINCILTDQSEHPYSLALKAYALALAKSPDAAKATIDNLLAKAVTNSSAMRWNLPDRKGTNDALHVETAAYALLALVTHDPKLYSKEARKIVRWLSSRRNGQGGFVSTQDTVVALQALTAFEKSQPQEALNMNVQISAGDLKHSFVVNHESKFLQQLVDLETLPSVVDLSVTGEGCSLIQGVLRYNVLSETGGEAFSLNVSTKALAEEQDCGTTTINICSSYNLADGASHMAIIEVKLVSGYVPLKEDLKKIIGLGGGSFKRYEVNGRKVIFYLEEISETICAMFRVNQEVAIENAKPGSVTVYDYYQPEYTTTEKFSLESNC